MLKKKIKVLETFSGIGAQHNALENLKNRGLIDYEVIGTSDWDVYAVQSYAAIHYPGYEKDIKDPTPEELTNFKLSQTFSIDGKKPFESLSRYSDEVYIKWYKAYKATKNIGSVVDSYDRVINDIILKNKSKIDLLTYSFPCQDLSMAGNFHGFNEGIKKHTRSGLLYEIEKLLKKLKEFKLNDNKDKLIKSTKSNSLLPKFLLLENVVNLVYSKHRKDFDIWLKELNNMGYKTIWGIVNANDFGMLQARRRTFALSIYDPNNKLKWEKDRDDLSFVLKELFDNKEFQPKWKQSHNEVFDFENKYSEESWLCQMKDTPSRRKMRDKGLKINPEYKGKISTITTKQDRWPNAGNLNGVLRNKDSKNNPSKYLKERFITPRESYKLMGFKDKDYEKAQDKMREVCPSFISAREKLYKQAGNSIATNALEMIFYYVTKLEKEVK